MRWWLAAILAMTTLAARADGLFAAWNNGVGDEPILQVQRVDRDTYVLRQSIRTNFEGPFLFLLFGERRILLIDSGAGGLQIRPTIERLIAAWRAETGAGPLPLVLAHTHGHGDHVAGDGEFAGQPDITVVGRTALEVAAFFALEDWPQRSAPFELGGRAIEVIPSPGHEPAEISFYDRRSGLLLTGDFLYPGRLYCRADGFQQFRDSVDRVVAATRGRDVRWILGNHIEMTATPGRDLPMHAVAHPDEHRLELPYQALLDLQASLQRMGPRPQLDIHPDFIFYPLP